MSRRERRAAARGSLPNSRAPEASTAAALYQSGLDHMRAGRFLDAHVCCQQAFAIEPEHADSLHLMGLLSFQTQNYDHAIQWFVRAIRQAPKPDYLSNLGIALRRQQRHDEALQVFDKALQLKPDDAELWNKRGNVLIDLKRPADAVDSFRQALKLDPHNPEAAYRCGYLLHELERWEEALPYLDLSHQLQPREAAVLERRALVLHHLKRLDAALADNHQAYALNPGNSDTPNNIGVALQALGRDDDAVLWFDRSLKLSHNSATALSKATSLQRLHRFDEAVEIYHRIKATDPDNAEADWNLSLLQLLHGDFEAAWRGRAAWWKIPALSKHYPKFPQPIFHGDEDVAGKTVLVHVDEGLGDSIQAARYLPMLAARGARVIVMESDAMVPLLSHLPGVAACLPLSSTAPLPPFDLHCPMSHLQLAFGTRLDTIPAAISYLPPPPETRLKAWRDRLADRIDAPGKLRVGLVWSGNPLHQNDHNRSLRLRALLPLIDADARFLSLQKDPRPEDKAVLLARPDIIDLTADLTDFVETAALISCLDLVVTVDTSVAHLAAALGRPTWILTSYLPDHRWLLDRDDSPWYPTVRLFRQSESRDYGQVVDPVRSALTTLIATR